MSKQQENYLEWYKKHRPQVWEDIVGQDSTVKALKNDVIHNAIPTGYIFTGMYGSGKTTAAKILAKAINCEKPPGDGNPCNSCETCLAIDSNNQFGFTYVSGAQNGSVDAIRKLLADQTYHQPIKKRVVILDEAHNLSSEALDATLIPLEDDSSNDVVYIICTTEIKKIKSTVRSRTKMRAFTSLDKKSLLTIIERVAKAENVTLTKEIADWVTRKAQGSAREAITLLEDAIQNGISTISYGEKLLMAIETHDIVEALAIISEAISAGATPEELTSQLIDDIRTILFIVENVDKNIAGDSIVTSPQAFCEHVYGQKSLIYCMRELSKAYTNMFTSSSSRVHLELAIIDYITILQKKDG